MVMVIRSTLASTASIWRATGPSVVCCARVVTSSVMSDLAQIQNKFDVTALLQALFGTGNTPAHLGPGVPLVFIPPRILAPKAMLAPSLQILQKSRIG